jgi:hypothetical protein
MYKIVGTLGQFIAAGELITSSISPFAEPASEEMDGCRMIVVGFGWSILSTISP